MPFGDRRSNRIDPTMLDTYHPDHRARYEFAAEQLAGGTVLDAGCGFGYGSDILAAHVDRVVGVDLYGEGIEYATKHYGSGRVRFEVADVAGYEPAEAPFDAIVCLEAIEHVEHDSRFISALRELLATDGVLIISTPNRPVTSPTGVPSDPTHVREYDVDDLTQLLNGGGFSEVDVHGLHLAREVFDRHQARSRLGHLDRLGVRRLIPARAKAAIVARLVPAAGRPATVDPSSISAAHDLIALAR